jgi:hypothetical protein
MKYHQTDRKTSFKIGVAISLLLIATPFLFYIYTIAPRDSKEWDTIFGTIEAGNFKSVQTFMHALFTKITFVLLTLIWFLTADNWWKYAILVPLTMFLFQFLGVISSKLQFIDEFDFWYSLPFIVPILAFLIYISFRISKKTDRSSELKNDVKEEINMMFSDEL